MRLVPKVSVRMCTSPKTYWHGDDGRAGRDADRQQRDHQRTQLAEHQHDQQHHREEVEAAEGRDLLLRFPGGRGGVQDDAGAGDFGAAAPRLVAATRASPMACITSAWVSVR